MVQGILNPKISYITEVDTISTFQSERYSIHFENGRRSGRLWF